jgi:hypothetical protein
VSESEPIGLNYLSDDEFRTHVRIMLEGTGHRGPQSWPLDNLDEDIYRELENRVPALAELRARMDALLDADLRRRQSTDPTAADVSDYADSGQSWADEGAEREWTALRDQWRTGATGWLERD